MVYHILNGDALRMQLEGQLEEPLYICRECLVDGPIAANDLASFFNMRRDFLMKSYDISKEEFEAALAEFQKIQVIPDDSVVYLWFEEDLFCQLNLWFTASLLEQKKLEVYLVLPKKGNPYSFAYMHPQELLNAMKAAKQLEEDQLARWAGLWKAYQQKDFELLFVEAKKQFEIWPFLLQAVQSAKDLEEGTVWIVLEQIIEKAKPASFGKVFQQFSEKFSYLGLGDLQVKRMYDQLLRKGE